MLSYSFLCHPHNPGGIVWTEDELQEILRLCKKYDVLILSDEIHADLVLPGIKHIPLAILAEEEADESLRVLLLQKHSTWQVSRLQS